MKRMVLLVLLVGLTIFLAAPLAVQAADPIKIGVLVPLSGIAAQGGVELRDGSIMAAEEKKTLLGRPIQLVIEDTQAKPDVGVSKAEKVVFKDSVIALVGVFSSGVGLAIAKNIDKLNVPFLTTHVMTTEFYGMHPLVFRSGQLANDQTAIGNVKGILSNEDLKKRKYYVLVHDYAWGHDAGKRFVELAKKEGINVVNPDMDKAAMNTTDWSTYISKIKASGADAVYIALITTVIPVFTKQAAEFGILKTCKIVSAAAPGVTELEAAGENGFGIFGASCYSWDIKSPANEAWMKRYFERFKAIPSDAAAHAYVGTMNLFLGIEKAGSTDPKKISDSIKGISFDGPYGKVRIATKDNCARNDAVWTETMAAPTNPYGAKVYMKVLTTFKAEELGPPEK